MLFDMFFVLVLSIAITAMMGAQLADKWNGPIGVMFPILLLYGASAMLFGYIVAHFSRGPLTAFLSTTGWSLLMYMLVAIAFAVRTHLPLPLAAMSKD
jgi:ATP-binding cassette, subfamily A (ABC1), member 3